MYPEEKLVPFHATDLTGKKILAIAPHPDDETLACGGSLALHTQAGDPVKVVFLTNGAKGDSSAETDRESYMKIRQDEAETACQCLGITDLDFWGYEDRDLAGSRGVLTRLIDLIETYKPELIYVSSLLEFHPDHRAAAVLLCEAIRVSDIQIEVAFYEVGQPLSANCLVDITPVLDRKISAADAYSSQLRERPYKDVILGLNRFRSLTLPEGITHAEAFSLWSANLIRTTGPFAMTLSNIRFLKPEAHEAGPLVSIIVRTKDRPEYLANALRSIVCQTYVNLEVVLVNDGGQDVEDLARSICENIPVAYVCHEESQGRSAAANAGLDHARGVYLIFLDDDDWFEPSHISSLIAALEQNPQAKVAYAGVRGVLNRNADQSEEELIFNEPFTVVGFIGGNYIPIHAALVHRSLLQSGCRFDESLEVYEDWDFWLQLSRLTPFVHLDRISAVYRASAASGVGLFPDEATVRRAREAIYEKWRKIWSAEEINAFLNQTQEALRAHANEVANLRSFLKGSEHHCDNLSREVARLTEEKQQLRVEMEKTLPWRVVSMLRHAKRSLGK